MFMKLILLIALFLVVGHPMTYQLVDSLFMGKVDIANEDGTATHYGVAVHAVVYALLFIILSKTMKI